MVHLLDPSTAYTGFLLSMHGLRLSTPSSPCSFTVLSDDQPEILMCQWDVIFLLHQYLNSFSLSATQTITIFLVLRVSFIHGHPILLQHHSPAGLLLGCYNIHGNFQLILESFTQSMSFYEIAYNVLYEAFISKTTP